MPLEQIVPALAAIEKKFMKAEIYESLPDGLGKLPAVLHWTGRGVLVSEDVLCRWRHSIEVKAFFSKVDLAKSDSEARSWIEPFRRALSHDTTLGGIVEKSKVAAYTYGLMTYGAVEYIGPSFTVEVDELLPAGEVEDDAEEV